MFRRIILILTAASIAFCACGCGSGRLLFETSADGFDFAVYGSEDGVHKVTVSKDGKKLQDLLFSARRQGQPYQDGDDQNFGLFLTDADLDGNLDVIVQTSRTAGSEKYIFYFGTNKDKFEKHEELSSATAPRFGDGSGKIYVEERKIDVFSEKTEHDPAMYTEYRTLKIYSRGETGVVLSGGEGTVYYSEEDIYCLVTYVTDENEPGTLIPDEEKWLDPSKYEALGYELFPPYGD